MNLNKIIKNWTFKKSYYDKKYYSTTRIPNKSGSRMTWLLGIVTGHIKVLDLCLFRKQGHCFKSSTSHGSEFLKCNVHSM